MVPSLRGTFRSARRNTESPSVSSGTRSWTERKVTSLSHREVVSCGRRLPASHEPGKGRETTVEDLVQIGAIPNEKCSWSLESKFSFDSEYDGARRGKKGTGVAGIDPGRCHELVAYRQSTAPCCWLREEDVQQYQMKSCSFLTIRDGQ